MALYCAPRGVSGLRKKKKKKKKILFDLIHSLFICEVQSARTGNHLRASKLHWLLYKVLAATLIGDKVALPLNSFKMHLLAFPFQFFFLGAHAQMPLEHIRALDPLTSTLKKLPPA